MRWGFRMKYIILIGLDRLSEHAAFKNNRGKVLYYSDFHKAAEMSFYLNSINGSLYSSVIPDRLFYDMEKQEL